MRALSLILSCLIAAASGETFKKTKMVDGKGKEVPVELDFDRVEKRLTVRTKKTVLAEAPYDTIDTLQYELSARRRVKEGAVVMIASLGVGAVVMLTKSKNHWLYVNQKPGGAKATTLTLKLDKSEFEKVMKVAAAETGKTVEKLQPEKSGGAKKGK